jgi:predicted NACHT family NTPase
MIDLSLKVVPFLLEKFADREFGKWLSSHENNRTFKNIMNAALDKTSEAGFKTRGTGAIDESFLWLKLLDPSVDDEIDYTRLEEELKNIYIDKNAVGSNEIKAIEFFADALMDEMWKESSLKDFLSLKFIRQHDLRLSLIKKKALVREYLTREGGKISNDLQEDIGIDAHYVEPLIEKCESKKNESIAEGLKDNLFAPENKIKDNENDSFIPVDMNTYFTEGSDHRIVVVADSGLGKTTLLKELFRRLSNNFDWDHPIPIYLTPSQAAGCSEANVRDIIKSRLMTCGMEESKVKHFIDMEFSQGRFLFLIDALDQISDRQKLLGCLEGPGFGNNRVVVTTRPNVWDMEKGHFKNYAYLNIRKFDETRWKEYIGEEKIRQIGEIADEEFFSVPILLRLLREYWLNDPNKPQRVKNRADLYEKIFKRLLERQEDTYAIIATRRYPYNSFDVRENLYMLAHDTLAENCLGQFPRSKARAILGKEELKEMETRGGILKILETGNEMAFRHKSFQEYLSAEYLKSIIEEDNGNFDKLQPYMRHPYWEESLRFLAGLLPSSKAQILIEKILDIPDEEAFALCRGHLRLAALCLKEIGEEGKNIRNRIIKELKNDCENEALKVSTIPILGILKDNESVSILCDLFIKAIKYGDSDVRNSAAEALGNIGIPENRNLLMQYWHDDDHDLDKRLLFKALKSCDERIRSQLPVK